MSLLARRGIRVVLDLGLLLGFVAEFGTREGPDYDLHSWIGVMLVPIILVHLASNWRWVRSTARRRNTHPEWKLARFNAGFSVVTAICIGTGFPVWLAWSDAGLWPAIHNLTGFVSILLALVHLWRNRRRLAALLRRR